MSLRVAWSEDTRPPAPPLSREEVAEAEAELGITFPDEYRDFLLTVSAGHGRVRRLLREPGGWCWDDDTDTDPEMLPVPFPHQDEINVRLGEHSAREPDFDDPAWQTWDEEGEDLVRWWDAGTVALQDYGCNYKALLVVTGPHRGTMWFDRRSSHDDIVRLVSDSGKPVGFAEWLARPWKVWFDQGLDAPAESG